MKRKKKSGMGNSGRPNPAYSSSIEKTKVGKKPKGDNEAVTVNESDQFDLDSLLGLGENEQVRPTNDIDLNYRPVNIDGNSETIIGPSVFDAQVNVPNILEAEIEATVSLGGKLGVHLQNSHQLIQDSIVQEGLQGGKS